MDCSRKEKVLYDLGADGVCEFQNGEGIRINRTMLAVQSDYFMDEFFGPTPKTIVKINDFDRDTFKLFLDCLFGLKKYADLDALLIYPIAHQYDVKESLQKCTAVLLPKKMCENVCLTLNMALFYNWEVLVDLTIDFIKSEVGIIDLMQNQKYRSVLEPEAVDKLFEDFEQNSVVVDLMYNWAKDYLKNHNESVDVNEFLIKNEMLSALQFESIQCLLDFDKICGAENGEVFCYLEKNLTELGKAFPNQSHWIDLDESYNIKETITFTNSFIVSNNAWLKIFANQVFVGNKLKDGKPRLAVTVKYYWRNAEGGWIHELRFYNFSWDFVGQLKNEPFDLPLSSEQPVHSDKMVVPSHLIKEIKSIEIKYDFTNCHNCKILKASLGSAFENCDELYFTKNVVVNSGSL